MRNFLCSNVHYFYYDTETFFRNSKEAGFQLAELYLGTPHIFINGQTIDDFSSIPNLAQKYGLRIKAVHPETLSFRYGLCYLDDGWNSKSLEAYKRCIDYAAKIGAERLDTSLTCGFRDHDQKLILKRCAENLGELIEYGAERAVTIALEAEEAAYQGFITDLSQMRQLDAMISDKRLLIGVSCEALKAAGEYLNQWETVFEERIAYVRTAEPRELSEVSFDGDVILFDPGETYLERPYALDRLAKREVNRWG